MLFKGAAGLALWDFPSSLTFMSGCLFADPCLAAFACLPGFYTAGVEPRLDSGFETFIADGGEDLKLTSDGV